MAKKKKTKEPEEPIYVCPLCGVSTSGVFYQKGVIECIDTSCAWRGTKEEADIYE